MDNQCMKFEVFSFSRSRHILRVLKIRVLLMHSLANEEGRKEKRVEKEVVSVARKIR